MFHGKADDNDDSSGPVCPGCGKRHSGDDTTRRRMEEILLKKTTGQFKTHAEFMEAVMSVLAPQTETDERTVRMAFDSALALFAGIGAESEKLKQSIRGVPEDQRRMVTYGFVTAALLMAMRVPISDAGSVTRLISETAEDILETL